jgi:hypothetical protein
MKRQDAVNLLKEITRSCSSFVNAQAVSITRDAENGGYTLSAKWVIDETEREGINSLAEKYDVKVSEKKTTHFSQPKPSNKRKTTKTTEFHAL